MLGFRAAGAAALIPSSAREGSGSSGRLFKAIFPGHAAPVRTPMYSICKHHINSSLFFLYPMLFVTLAGHILKCRGTVFFRVNACPTEQALNERSVLRIFMEVKARVRTAAPAVRKPHVSEVSGHQSGHRVWGEPEPEQHKNSLQNSANTTPVLWGRHSSAKKKSCHFNVAALFSFLTLFRSSSMCRDCRKEVRSRPSYRRDGDNEGT